MADPNWYGWEIATPGPVGESLDGISVEHATESSWYDADGYCWTVERVGGVIYTFALEPLGALRPRAVARG